MQPRWRARPAHTTQTLGTAKTEKRLYFQRPTNLKSSMLENETEESMQNMKGGTHTMEVGTPNMSDGTFAVRVGLL